VKTSDLPALLNGMEYGYSLWTCREIRRTHCSAPGSGSRQRSCDSRTSANTLQYEFLRVGNGSGPRSNVPMNRWVHVTMVYREGAITFFMVGEVTACIVSTELYPHRLVI
jgi:hypothetical protein